ncbi:MAG: ion transporter [Candidatus Woesearchaeota archaeon]|jgi:membrane protein YdbS with pleckstrin-like domain
MIPEKKEVKITFREILREKIFEGDSKGAKIFDVILIITIILSVIATILESISVISTNYSGLLLRLEWFFTILFSIEYILRVYSAKERTKYIFSFTGIIDIISILPLYISLFIKGEQILQVIRLLRLVRISSRLFTATRRIDEMSKSVFNLHHHLGSNEKVLMYFRPSRKERLFYYTFTISLMGLSVIEVIFDIFPQIIISNTPVTFVASYIVFTVSLILLIKAEIKIWSERYTITNERIFYCYGIISEHFKSISYKYVTDISLYQSIWDKIIKTGNLNIHTAGGEGTNFEINYISDPLKIKKLINDNITIAHQNNYQNQEHNNKSFTK